MGDRDTLAAKFVSGIAHLTPFSKGDEDPISSVKAATRWIAALPIGDVFTCQQSILGELKRLNEKSTQLTKDHLAGLMLLDEKAQDLQDTLVRQYLRNPRMSRSAESQLWHAVYGLYWESARGYYTFGQQFSTRSEKSPYENMIPLITLRAIRAFGHLLKWRSIRYLPAGEKLWLRQTFFPRPVTGTERNRAFSIMHSGIPVHVVAGIIADLPVVPTLNAQSQTRVAATAAPTTTPTPANVQKYTVELGDTLSEIARKFDVSVNDIKALNNLPHPDILSEGQVLVIPGSPLTPTPTLVPIPTSTRAPLPVITGTASTALGDFFVTIREIKSPGALAGEQVILTNLSGQPEVAHGFSHYRLDIEPRRAGVAQRAARAAEPGALWLSVEEALAAAIPAPVRRILQSL